LLAAIGYRLSTIAYRPSLRPLAASHTRVAPSIQRLLFLTSLQKCTAAAQQTRSVTWLRSLRYPSPGSQMCSSLIWSCCPHGSHYRYWQTRCLSGHVCWQYLDNLERVCYH